MSNLSAPLVRSFDLLRELARQPVAEIALVDGPASGELVQKSWQAWRSGPALEERRAPWERWQGCPRQSDGVRRSFHPPDVTGLSSFHCDSAWAPCRSPTGERWRTDLGAPPVDSDRYATCFGACEPRALRPPAYEKSARATNSFARASVASPQVTRSAAPPEVTLPAAWRSLGSVVAKVGRARHRRAHASGDPSRCGRSAWERGQSPTPNAGSKRERACCR